MGIHSTIYLDRDVSYTGVGAKPMLGIWLVAPEAFEESPSGDRKMQEYIGKVRRNLITNTDVVDLLGQLLKNGWTVARTL